MGMWCSGQIRNRRWESWCARSVGCAFDALVCDAVRGRRLQRKWVCRGTVSVLRRHVAGADAELGEKVGRQYFLRAPSVCLVGRARRGHAEPVYRREGQADSHTNASRKGRKFAGSMLDFGSVAMFRVSGKVHGGSMQES